MTSSGLGLADPARENALLVAIIEAISTGAELGPLAAKVAALIVEATATDVCFVHLLDESSGMLTLAGATPPFADQVGQVELPLGAGITGWVASHRRPVVIVEHKEADPRYRYFPQLRGQDYTSMASVPMASGPSGLVGVLNVHTLARREFGDHDVRLLTSIGSIVAGAMHQARLMRQLEVRQRAAERFAEQVIGAQEAERRRLAGDIHDGITQRLFSLRFHLEAAVDAVAGSPEFAVEQLARAHQLTDLALAEARSAIHHLRPPVLDDLGLADGLASLARTMTALEVSVDADECELPDHVEIALYRIAQEALQNVVKHAETDRAWLVLRATERQVLLRVSDQGRGFDREVPVRGDHGAAGDLGAGPDDGGYGMRSMAERAELAGGQLEVTSRPDRGTTVTVRIPR